MIIIKVGGGKDINIKGIVSDLSKLQEKFIVVLGANYVRDKILESLGKTKRIITSVSGYDSVFSDEDAISTIMMAYSGLRSKRFVELCQQHSINAIGVSGIDAQLIRGQRNRGIKIREGSKLKILRDFSGKPKFANGEFLRLLLENGYVPVLTIPILDENNFAINSENDDIVALLQKELQADKIIQLIEAKGLLKDKDDPDSVISSLSKHELHEWENEVKGRMKRKIYALRKLSETRCEILLSDGRVENPIKNAFDSKGTKIK
jgi:acetylglutamate/LysW-gamma-L-alpha-aminoadipate kinase